MSTVTAAPRAAWHRKASRPVLIWFALLIILAVVHQWVPDSRWLLVHMFTLGMVTNSILIWSQHFTEALLKNRLADNSRPLQLWRIRILNAGIVVTIAGILARIWPLTLLGAVVIAAMVTWHAVNLMLQLRTALPARFAVTVRFYIAAALLLPVGAGFGATLAFGLDAGATGRFLLAHELTNLLGFVGLAIIGTLVTLWPTILRTRMVEGQAQAARISLAGMLAALGLMILGALAGVPYLAGFGALVYLLAVGYLGLFLLRCAMAKPPNDYPTFAVAAGILWLAGSLIGLFAILMSGPLKSGRLEALTVPFVVGFIAQVLFGAMSYLLPAVMGGGPAVVRRSAALLSRFAALRVAVINFGLVAYLLPLPGWARVFVSVLVLAAFAAFLPLLLGAVRVFVTGHRDGAAGVPGAPAGVAGKPSRPDPKYQLAWVAAGLALVLAAVGAGAAVDSAVGRAGGTGGVVQTGQTTTVRVSANGMRFSPEVVEVPAGNRLVIELTNDDPSTVHDLVLANGADSGRLYPGESKTIDAGIIGAPVDGWCSVVGHRAKGMVFAVKVAGSGGPAGPSPAAPAGQATDAGKEAH